ncbi:hypothetical protein [Ectobacillus funiculus]|uniref:Uncharacterized protein n=1 Tax=Ectobacillus funiculus TaxID=137993 RepID=A0ABV5WAJ7_9BACI
MLFLYFTLIRFTNLFVTRYRSLLFERRWKEWIVGVLFFAAPWWLSCLVGSFTLFALSQHTGEHWKGFANQPILRLPVQEGRAILVGRRARIYTLVPALVLYSIIGTSLLSIWVGIVLFLLVAGTLVRYAFIGSSYGQSKKRKEQPLPFIIV